MNIRLTTIFAVALSTTVGAAACGVPDPVQPEISPAACEILEQTIPAVEPEASLPNALASSNAASLNGITLNALTYNGLPQNGQNIQGLDLNGQQVQGQNVQGLNINGKNIQGLESDAVQPPADTELGRMYLKYAIGCMLSSDQSVTFVASDETEYTYTGVLGLAPAWTERGLDEDERSWLSACMLAHVNAFGIAVPISARAADLIEIVDGEEEAYPVLEGAFFGDIEVGKYFSCQGQDADTALAASAYRAARVCTDADERCALEVVGMCEEVCETAIPGRGYLNCRAGDELYPEVVTIFLHSDAAFAECGLD